MNRHVLSVQLYREGQFQKISLHLLNGHPHFCQSSSPLTPGSSDVVIDGPRLSIFPGFTDMHVHLREPGFSYKETIATGTAAAAHGGYTTVCPMPNLQPVPDSLKHLNPERDAIARDACVHVLPYGSITRGQKGEQLAAMEEMAAYVVGFTDDGVGVANEETMRRAMREAKRLEKPIVAHAEDLHRVQGGVIHDGTYARRHHLPGNPSESEWRQVERDLRLVAETGVRYHICHISTKETVALLRKAQREGLPVTGETAPHYLTLTDEDLQDDGRFRMNPPIRSGADREALREAAADGTLLCIATDHAPHSAEEKAGGLLESKNGIVGLETAFAVLYTDLVCPGILPLSRVVDMLTVKPQEAFHLSEIPDPRTKRSASYGEKIVSEGTTPLPGEIETLKDFSIWDLNASQCIDSSKFFSKGRAMPWEGKVVRGVCLATFVDGYEVYASEEWKEMQHDAFSHTKQ